MLAWLKNNSYARDSLIGQVRYQAIESAKRGGAAWAALKNATAGNLGPGGRTYEAGFEAPARINNRNAQIGAAWRAHRDAAAEVRRAAPALSGHPYDAGLHDISGNVGDIKDMKAWWERGEPRHHSLEFHDPRFSASA
jgi:hypothetical protein